MKKFLILFFIVAFVCAFAFGGATASAEVDRVSAELTVAEEGEEILVTASLTKNEGVTALSLRVEYDENAFELLGSTFKSALSSLDPTDAFHDDALTYSYPYRAIYIGFGGNKTDTGELFVLRFRLKEGAVNGKKDFKLFIYDMAYYAGSEVVTPAEFEGATASSGVKVAEDSFILTNGSIPKGESKLPLIIGLSVGGAAILALLAAAAFTFYRKKNATKNKA